MTAAYGRNCQVKAKTANPKTGSDPICEAAPPRRAGPLGFDYFNRVQVWVLHSIGATQPLTLSKPAEASLTEAL